MFNGFKATIRKWAGLPFQDVSNLLRWQSASFQIDNPNLLVAKATDENDESSYATVEPIFLVECCAASPRVADSTGVEVFNSIISAIEAEAQSAGVRRMFIVLPDNAPSDPEEKWIRVIESKFPQTVSVTCNGAQQGCYEHPIVVRN